MSTWLRYLLAAAISGFAHGMTTIGVSMLIGADRTHAIELALANSAVGAIVAVGAYLQRKPLPDVIEPGSGGVSG